MQDSINLLMNQYHYSTKLLISTDTVRAIVTY